MGEMVAAFSAAALMEAIDANLVAKSLSFPRVFKGEIHGPNPTWFITGAALPHYNGVARATFDLQDVHAGIEAALAPFKARKVPLTWWVGPSTSPSNLGAHLQAHGFTHNRDMLGMAVDLACLPEPDLSDPALTFEQVADRGALADWYQVFLQGFPTSFDAAYLDALAVTSLGPDAPWIHYLARLDGRPVAVGSLFLSEGVAGFYNLTTLREARGKGIGAWMTLKTFQQAVALGIRIGTLQTTYPNALRLYHRLGFEVYCKIGVYKYVPGT